MTMDPTESKALALQAKQGDREAFARLLSAHYERIYRLAFRWTGQRQDAEDVAQEVCIKLGRAIDGFRGDAAFSTWVHGITLNALKDWSRKHQRQQQEVVDPDLETQPDPAADPERALLGRLIRRCIALLPEPLRAAVLLVHAEGLNHREAGAALDCAEGTVSWRLNQARQQLTTCLEAEG